MAGDARASTFVTGAAGFIGTELVRVLLARGHQVFGLTQSVEAAQRMRRAGAVPSWATCSSRVNGRTRRRLTGSSTFRRTQCGPRVTWRRAESITRARVLMDAHLLDAVAAGATRRIVYVADTSCYGGGIGFRFRYPTLDQGLQQVLGALHE